MPQERDRQVRCERRRLITAAGGTLVLALAPLQFARGANLLGVRLWPARDYTRVALEHDEPLKFTQFMIRETPPLRLVVDIEGIELTPGFRDLVAKVEPNDPYIGLIRVGQNRPKVVRLVIELKEDVKPQVFALDPVGPYQYRLLLDLYPVNPPDPLMALLREQSTPRDSDFGSVPPAATTERLRRHRGRHDATATTTCSASSRSPSIPDMVARTQALSAAPAPTRRTSRCRSHAGCASSSLPIRACA